LGDLDDSEVYTIEDFTTGRSINIYNREFYLYDADNFTKKFYKEQFGVELNEVDLLSKLTELGVTYQFHPHVVWDEVLQEGNAEYGEETVVLENNGTAGDNTNAGNSTNADSNTTINNADAYTSPVGTSNNKSPSATTGNNATSPRTTPRIGAYAPKKTRVPRICYDVPKRKECHDISSTLKFLILLARWSET
jgi:hypothetical protein